MINEQKLFNQSEKRPDYHQQAEVNGIKFTVGFDPSYQDYVLYFPQIEIDVTGESNRPADQLFRIDNDPEKAKQVFEYVAQEANKVSDVYELFNKALDFSENLNTE